MQPREQSLPAIPYSTSQPVQYIDLPKDGHGQMLKLTLLATLDLAAGGGASGTKSAFPPSTIAAIKRMWVEVTGGENGGMEGGNKLEISPHLWHRLAYKVLRRKPVYSEVATGGVQAGTALEAEMVLPLSIANSKGEMESLLALAGRTTARLWVEWYSTDALTIAAMIPGTSRTPTFTNMRIEVELVDFVEDSTPRAKFQTIWRQQRFDITGTGKNDREINVPPGEFLRTILGVDTDNGSPTDGVTQEITVKIGKEQKKYYKRGQLQRKNRGDAQVQVADWETGLWWVDFDVKRDLVEPPPIKPKKSTPRIVFDQTGGSAPTAGNSYIDSLIETFAPTKYGREVFAARGIPLPDEGA